MSGRANEVRAPAAAAAARRYDRGVGIALICLAAGLYWQTLSFPLRPFVVLNTTFWPRVILGALAAVGLVLALRGQLTDEPAKALSWRSFFALAGACGFVAAIPLAGFAPAAFVLALVVYLWLSGPRKPRHWVVGTIYAAAVSGGIYVLFRFALNVRLPLGLLG